MFEKIKKKYKNICDLQKEIEKINKKWKNKNNSLTLKFIFNIIQSIQLYYYTFFSKLFNIFLIKGFFKISSVVNLYYGSSLKHPSAIFIKSLLNNEVYLHLTYLNF